MHISDNSSDNLRNRQSVGNVACFRYTFGIDLDDNVLKNLRLISRCVELDEERNITASIAIDLQQNMAEGNHVGSTRDELS